MKVIRGQRYLGGFIGDPEGTKHYVEAKVQTWVTSVDKLSTAAESQPQAAYAAFSKSLQFEWSYLQRVLPNFGTSFAPLRDVVNKKFWPSVFGGQICNICSLYPLIWEV